MEKEYVLRFQYKESLAAHMLGFMRTRKAKCRSCKQPYTFGF